VLDRIEDAGLLRVQLAISTAPAAPQPKPADARRKAAPAATEYEAG
jgi:hypothetical protein